MTFHEINFDGIVGPTHNYAGLSVGNIASATNAQCVSRPRQAALEGLAKMKYLAGLGLKQAVLPPQLRPSIAALCSNGYEGEADEVIRAAAEDPYMLATCSSASSMWTANAATFSPSADTIDGKPHITPANLVSKYHRAIEAKTTAHILKQIFPEPHFVHHAPLSGMEDVADEGAANHMRLCRSHGEKGVEVFVYGRAPDAPFPEYFPARQSVFASRTIAFQHQLPQQQIVYAQQNPAAIDCGVFHNDVIAVANETLLLVHAHAWLNQPQILEEIRKKAGFPLHIIEISPDQLTVEEAVESYFFNSQIVTLPEGGMAIIAPKECEIHDRTRLLFEKITTSGNPVQEVHYIDVRESMKNGGGPACLRLRVVLSEEELALVKPSVMFSESLYGALVGWVNRHYRDELNPEDLGDPALYHECNSALDEVYALLKLDRMAEQ